MEEKARVWPSLMRAWATMYESLFRIVRYDKWLTLAFAAWLANLGCGWGMGFQFPANPFSSFQRQPGQQTEVRELQEAFKNFNFQNPRQAPDIKLPDFQALEDACKGVMPYISVFLALVILAVFFVVAVGVLWLTFRGKFVFLDNVLNNKAEIVRPWKAYANESFSAFLWYVYFILAALLLQVVIAVPMLFAAVPWLKACSRHKAFVAPDQSAAVVLVAGCAALALTGLACALVGMFFNEFVLPIMYKRRISAFKAWGVLVRMTRANKWAFAKYTGAYILVRVATALFIYMVCLMTCCCCGIGFIILNLPYLWAVVTLPILVFFRLFPVDFLGQIDGDFALQKPPPETETMLYEA